MDVIIILFCVDVIDLTKNDPYNKTVLSRSLQPIFGYADSYFSKCNSSNYIGAM